MSDRAREGLFSSLDSAVVGSQVLDLYAGSGALAIEALSRGASRAVLVERDRAALNTIRENLARTRMDSAARVLSGEVETILRRKLPSEAPFDLVFIDAPYALAASSMRGVLKELGRRWVAGRWTVVATRRAGGQEPPIPPGWICARRLRYGDTAVQILRAS
jgi:16S rRNA (guanine(966)-N(2))-methyltransferase RsmD